MANRPTLSFYRSFIVLLSLPVFASAAFSNSGRSYHDILRSFTSGTNVASRASVVLPSGWISHGCVREPSSGRTLTASSMQVPNTKTSAIVETLSKAVPRVVALWRHPIAP
ncbi:hypothetical protein B0H10DRAFT_1226492 [Mycena sp. CBHHK59/15]|nr:hypothetical protein B0H10DRAFT_1226492 [Mycena sp. CBHHK59/15]